MENKRYLNKRYFLNKIQELQVRVSVCNKTQAFKKWIQKFVRNITLMSKYLFLPANLQTGWTDTEED